MNTQVGNDYVRGVSGGERKRVSISEAALSNSPLQCWDNSIRGLDSANIVQFCRALRLQADVSNVATAVAIFFRQFDKRQSYIKDARYTLAKRTYPNTISFGWASTV